MADDKRCWTCDQRVEVVERGLTQHVVGLDAEALVTAGRIIEVLTGERDLAERRAAVFEVALNAIADYDVREVKRAKYIAGEEWPDFTDEVQLIAERALAATSPREGA